jgi:AraC-like DNA-binding protein
MKVPVQFPSSEFNADLKLKGFKVYQSDNCHAGPSRFGRRHFYKIVLSIGRVVVNYADRRLDLDGVHLFFANPHVPYAVEILPGGQRGYGCIFTESFIKPLERQESAQQSPLFNLSASSAFRLDEGQQARVSGIFESMIAEQTTAYLYKDDLMRNYIQLLLHEGLRRQPEEHSFQFKNAALRLTTLFLELLERQFPVENLNVPLRLKTAQDYANGLSIHVNYLNRTVKEVTGKSTTTHIAERVVAEAITLLQYTDWSVADIAYALGFEYPNYFSNFFKKMTGNIPKAYRTGQV